MGKKKKTQFRVYVRENPTKKKKGESERGKP